MFQHTDNKALESVLIRAIGLWYSYPGVFRELILNGMNHDFSWSYPGQKYLEIYHRIWSRT